MSTVQEVWYNFLDQIILTGHTHTKDSKLIHEKIHLCAFLENPMRNLYYENKPERYIETIKGGYLDVNGYPMKGEALADYVSSLDEPDTKGFVYTYPNRLLNHFPPFSDNKVNQLDIMCQRLIDDKGTNRAVAVIYDPYEDSYNFDYNEPGLLVEDIPCLNWIQALIRDNELELHVMFRSNDIYGAFPANMLFIHYIGLKLVHLLSEYYPLLQYKGVFYNCTSGHIYDTDLEMAKLVLKR